MNFSPDGQGASVGAGVGGAVGPMQPPTVVVNLRGLF